MSAWFGAPKPGGTGPSPHWLLATLIAGTLVISAVTAVALRSLTPTKQLIAGGQISGTNGNSQGAAGPGGGAAPVVPGAAHEQGVSGGVINLGSIITQTGPGRSTTMAHAVIAWEKSVNAAGGINGYKVNVDIKDDQGNPDLGASEYRQLNDDEKVFALVSECAPIPDAQQVGYINQSGLPVLGECQSSPEAYSSPYLWIAGPTPYQNGQLGAALTTRTQSWPKSGGKVALVCLDDPSTLSVCYGARDRYGAGALWNGGPQMEQITDDNYAQLISEWQSAGVQDVHLVLDPASVERYLYAAQSAGWNPPTMNNLVIDEGIGSQFSNANGMLIGTPWTPLDASSAGMQRFRSAMQRYFPDDRIDLYAETGWMGCLLIEHAISLMGNNPSRAHLLQIMNSGFKNWDTGMGPVENFSASNHEGPFESALMKLENAGSESWHLVTAHSAVYF